MFIADPACLMSSVAKLFSCDVRLSPGNWVTELKCLNILNKLSGISQVKKTLIISNLVTLLDLGSLPLYHVMISQHRPFHTYHGLNDSTINFDFYFHFL